ncbi:ABC transporter G family member 20-like isoform X2 [Babylonia areolata]|uniref:ABC transporter G family member 20-like isoform X2 n=1 Tax=Babylonia areolata TaxID=304850 RepID=UPI003FD4624D
MAKEQQRLAPAAMGDAGRRLKPSASNAVWARRVCKTYGKGKKKNNVLSGINLNVPYGAIYGLLGPSGCGKTTLLRCIVGLLKVDSGSLLAMGDVPGARDHSIPGPMVGYMPQDISLYNELTIEELLMYYGRVHGMTKEDITYRCNFLLDFLKLPARSSCIELLSGGQKRRVSLAAALLHKPGLLILDEPTVGVDPVLREKIWEHLLEIAQSSQQTTIIITTHYIEEARQADKVGLMRGGRLLEEDKPSVLMDRYNMTSLEGIFLHLCHHDIIGNAEDEELMSGNFGNSEEFVVSYEEKKTLLSTESANSADTPDAACYGSVTLTSLPRGRPSKPPCCVLPTLPSPRVMLALVFKNLIIMKRSIGLLFFEFIIPSIQIILFCLCIGRHPHDLKIGVFNDDLGSMGDLYLTHLDNDTFTKVPYEDLETAKRAVKEGHTWGVIEIGNDFSTDLMLRYTEGAEVTTDVVEGSSVYLHLDYTSQQIAAIIRAMTMEAFQDFSRQTLVASNHNVHYSDPPVMLGDAVYGNPNTIFTEFMAPGICNSITFFMATGLTTLAFVLEKRGGNHERNLVNGVTPSEVMLSHVITQFLVLLVQVTLLLLCTFLIFKIPLVGSWVHVLSLILLQGLCGMCLGIMISSCCEKETSAMQLSLGLVYPLLLTSGIIWPIQAVPEWLMYISEGLPLTIATDALRSVMGRGWGMANMGVWLGYLISLGWCLVFLILTAIIVRLKS